MRASLPRSPSLPRDPAAAHRRRPRTPDRRARVPARREGGLEANGVFSPLIRESSRLRERRIARTRSLPAPGPPAVGQGRGGKCFRESAALERQVASLLGLALPQCLYVCVFA